MSADTSFLSGVDFLQDGSLASNESNAQMDFLNSAPSNDFLNSAGQANTNNPLNNTINPASTTLGGDFAQQLSTYSAQLPSDSKSSPSTSAPSRPSMSASNSSHTSATSQDVASSVDTKEKMTTRSQVKRPTRSGLSLHDSITSPKSKGNDQDSSALTMSEDESPPPPPKKKRAARGGGKKPAKAQRRKSLERNRLAASKCRQKKKEWMNDLEDTKASLEKQHNNLLSEFSALTEEITELKNSLVAHAGCNDRNIDGWINNEAAKYVQRVRTSQDTNGASDDRDDSVSLPTPTDVNYGGLPIPMDQYQKGNGSMDDLEKDYMNEPMFNEDVFMQQPQDVL